MNLNEEQQQVVLSDADKILCLAGAGTGKTSCMLERISHLVETGVNPQNILVLTFTNAAAFEMKDRYRRSHESRSTPEFRTFHSFCYSLLAMNPMLRRKLGYTDVPTIADDNVRKRLIREASTMTGIKSSIESLSKKTNRSIKEKHDYEILQKTIRKLMQKKNVITFDELCDQVCKLFTNNDFIVDIYKRQYQYVFVDEFQDTDPVQNDFMNSFTSSKLFVVGDALQAIYAFRGADSSIIKKLSVNPEWTTYKLFRNYRSPKTVCDFANKNSKHADDSFRVTIESGTGEEGNPIVRKLYHGVSAYGEINTITSKYCLEDVVIKSGSTAILCRTNKEVQNLQSIFDDNFIVYRSAKKTVDVKNILLSIGDNQHLLDWLSSYLNAESYADYIRAVTLREAETDNHGYGIADFMKDFGNNFAIHGRWEQVRTLRRICKDTSLSVMERCDQVLDFLDCSYIQLDETKCPDIRTALHHMLDVYLGDEEVPGSDIYIGTIHSVKGLEFDNVYVVGVNDLTFKLNDEENKNLYYVAITRAKNNLVVFEKELIW